MQGKENERNERVEIVQRNAGGYSMEYCQSPPVETW